MALNGGWTCGKRFGRTVFLLLSLAAVLPLAACSREGPAPADGAAVDPGKVFRWKMVTTWPANFPIFQDSVLKFADDLRAMSSGRLSIQVFAGDELVPALQVFDAVSQGAVELGHGSPYYWAGKVPAGQVFSTVPFGMTVNGMHAWLYHGGGLDLWREVYEPFNLVPFPMGNSGVQMGGWFNKRIDSIADLQGLRMRIPGLGGKVLKKAGGNPVLMSGAEIYTALERGMIDAVEWVGPFHDTRLGLNRAARYYYYPGWHEPGTEFELLVNRNRWNSLPPDLQAMIETAARATGSWVIAAMEFHNHAALEELRQRHKVQILPFPDDVLQRLRELTEETLEEEAAKDAQFRRVYDAYREFRDRYADWNEISEGAFRDAKK
jgi:TRAP-type mannitol/chloroaromatic compound transport system substrate-binding protein